MQNIFLNSFIILSSKQFHLYKMDNAILLIDCSLTVKAATLIFISGRRWAISSAKQGKSSSIYNLVKKK